ncbi:DUF1697 domain-containing protein [Paenisporosarcina indica]|uniref:DUF1697 domain-containing protein n=1 Tax=Paenisporosarcina indica TaxID=650093 RepID=UPI00094F75A7|nr:DUF1697 domain-containing protein [Paenisporosarcina indica]
MTIYIAFLRGINVGGHNKIKMADLRLLLETMGLGKVQTYIQSGNVLFESSRDSEELRQQLEKQIKNEFGFSVPVILRTSAELEYIIENNPFSFDHLIEGESIHLSLLSEYPPQKGVNHLLELHGNVDECEVKDKEIYVYLRQSIRISKLAARIQKIGVPSTSRNWKTVKKLEIMAKEME